MKASRLYFTLSVISLDHHISEEVKTEEVTAVIAKVLTKNLNWLEVKPYKLSIDNFYCTGVDDLD